MLDLMRRHARNWLMKVILGIIIIVFIFYFGSMGGRQRAERIAIIDGKPIVYADFQREYQKLADMYRQRFGQVLTDEMLKSLNLKQQALDNLVNQAIVLRKAKEMNVEVTDEDVKAMILAYKGFQQNDAFNQRIYEQTLRMNKMTPDEFEEIQRKTLIMLRVEDLIRDTVKVSDQEVNEIYRMQNEKIDLDFIQISPKAVIGGIKTTPADLEAYLKAHEGEFRVPEQVQLKYLAFLGQDYASASKISDAEVTDYYERHKDQWTKDKKVQPLSEVKDKILADMRLINGMYAAADEAKKAHDIIYQNENFDAYTAEKKLPVHTTGLFRVTDPPPEFRAIGDFQKIVSSLQQNEISRVLPAEKGYYVIIVAARKAPYLPALREIEPEVERRYRSEEAKRQTQKLAEGLLARLKKGENLDVVAREQGVKVAETGLFQPGGAVPKIGSSNGLTEALMQISEKKPYPDQPYLIDDNYVIVRFKEKGKLNEAEFAAQKDDFTKYLAQLKKNEAVTAWLESTKAALIKEGLLQFTRDFKDL
jgi:peptidyl-prolyl cis-trans isomerase D